MVANIVNTDKIFYAVRLLKDSFWNYRFKFIYMLILGFISGLFGGIGIGALIPLFSFLTKEKGAEIDLVSAIIKRVFSFFNVEYSLLYLIAFIVFIFILKAVVIYFNHYFNQKISTNYEKDARSELFKKTLNADWPHLLEQKIGYIESVLVEDIHASSGILINLSGLIMISTSIIMYAAVAVNISVPITLLTFGIGITALILLKPLFYKIRKTNIDLALTTKQFVHHVSEHLIGAKTVKTMAVENEIFKAGNEYFENFRRMRVKIDLYNRLQGTFFEPVSLLFVSLIFSFYYYLDSSFNLASFVAIVYLIQKEFSFMQAIQNNLNSINHNLPRLKIYMDYKKVAENCAEIDSGSETFQFNEKLEFKKVSFAYDKKDMILSDLDLTVKKGEMIGLIGTSGAGKTTLVDTLLRLFPIGSGEILLDGKNILRIGLNDWRKNIGYVSQDAFLLNDTIENNIRFYNNDLTQEDIIRAVKIANIHDFIENQPNKFSTLVGERGIKLSGGQRQRIILARIIAKNPEILILDEATSALDNESELLIHEAIGKLKGQMTMLVIAHRLSTIMDSDSLYVLESGRITEHGTPAELLKDKDSYFYKVYNIRER